jgi:type III secretion apparatus needle protein
MAGGISIGALSGLAQSSVANVESALSSQFQAMAGKTDMSPTDMMEMQLAFSNYTTTIQSFSSMIKELKDATQGVINKM